MAAKLIYFGADTCHRLPVLRRAGYLVENCRSAEHLGALLESGEIDAVITTDRDGDVPDHVVAEIRSHWPVPVILFRDSNRNCNERRFDLVIAALTSPPRWLEELESLIPAAPRFGGQTLGQRFEALRL
jgi:hypothetical protein